MNFSSLLFFKVILKFKITWIENMSTSNEELETISLYDMVDDESEINEDQSDVDLSLND